MSSMYSMSTGLQLGLRDIESRLPPGHPSDDELISYYLRPKVAANHNHQASRFAAISPPLSPATAMMVEVVDLHERAPWELPVAAKVSDGHWYFFSSRDRKYATGSRTNRATKLGYWKATGKDKAIVHGGPAPTTSGGGMVMVGGDDAMVIGTRKTLVFYLGRAPNGRKTGWVMNEFRLTATSVNPPPPKEWMLCRVFHKAKGEDEQDGSCSSYIDIGPGGSCAPPPLPLPQRVVTERCQSQSLPTTIISSPIVDGYCQQRRLDSTLDDHLLETLLQAQDTSSSLELWPAPAR